MAISPVWKGPPKYICKTKSGCGLRKKATAELGANAVGEGGHIDQQQFR
jgi:hypothetical protein